MRAVLQAISEELARLKAEGESVVPVSEEAMAGLRALIAAQSETDSGGLAEPRAEPAAAVGRPVAEAVKKDAVIAAPKIAPKIVLAPVVAKTLPPPPTVVLPEGDRAARWAALQALVRADPLVAAQGRADAASALLGAGALDAKLFFVGDSPTEEEVAAGALLAGPAGELLAKMIGAMGVKPERVFVTNHLCWRPAASAEAGGEVVGGGRTPTVGEMAYCAPYLRAMLEIVDPEIVVALGGAAAQGMLGGKFTTLAAVRSQWSEFAGKPLLVTYSPSYLLRNGTNKSKRAVWEDLLQVMQHAELPISEKQRGYFLR
jgi:DNA polymerase